MTEDLNRSTTLVLKLLVVEDEAMTAMLIEDALHLHGHVVIGIAETASEAISIADRERPDIALCDVRLRDGENGVSVAHALADSGVVCLYLSAHCPAQSSHELIIGCLAKPFHTASIGLAVRCAHDIAQGLSPGQIPPGMFLF